MLQKEGRLTIELASMWRAPDIGDRQAENYRQLRTMVGIEIS